MGIQVELCVADMRGLDPQCLAKAASILPSALGRKVDALDIRTAVAWAAMMICSDCDANLDDVAVEAPCPSCGGARRNTIVDLTVALGVGVVMRASASVGYNPVRPWQEKWRDIDAGLVMLESFYVRDDANNEDARRGVEDFFKACRELADWLKAHAPRPEAMTFVNTDPALQICDGMAQT